MKKVIIAAAVVAVSALAGAAQAAGAATNYEFLQAARCRGLAASEGLGKLDTAGIDTFLRDQGASRELPVRVSAKNKIAAAQKEGDKADGAKKEKLLAERSSTCSAWLSGATTGAAVNTAN
jgi:hypothetical protein